MREAYATNLDSRPKLDSQIVPKRLGCSREKEQMNFTILVVLTIFLSGCTFCEVDRCLDHGGKWDHEKKQCVFE
jgi:hypothetical protein